MELQARMGHTINAVLTLAFVSLVVVIGLPIPGRNLYMSDRFGAVHGAAIATFRNFNGAIGLETTVETTDVKTLLCLVCEASVLVIRKMLSSSMSFQDVAAVVLAVCEFVHVETPDVCVGIVDEFKVEVLVVLYNSSLTDSEVCNFALGDFCKSDLDERFKWSLPLPASASKPVPNAPPTPVKGTPKLRVLQLSDIHVDFNYQPGSNANCQKPLCCQNGDDSYTGSFEPAGKWGDYNNCDLPPWTLEHLFQHLSIEDHFDYILWTGDQIAHRVWNTTRTEQLQVLSYITKLFLKYFPDVPVFPAVGNHESVPVNSFPPSSVVTSESVDWLYEAFVENWSHWLNNSAQSSLRRWLMYNMTDPEGELQWFVDVLLYAETHGEKVHIIGHIPPGSSGCLKWWSWNYYSIISRFEAVVAAQFFGHIHTDSWQMFYDVASSFNRPISVAYIAPSVTPFSQLNPGYRVYEIEGFYQNSSWQVLDHETFIFNLSEANLAGHFPVWKKEYSAKSTYNMTGLTAGDWQLVYERLLTDEALFDTYYRYYYKQHPVESCGASCRKAMLCDIRSGRSHDPLLCNTSPDRTVKSVLSVP